MNKDSHTVQQQLGTSEKGGNMPQYRYLMHNKRMNPTSSINYLQLNNAPLELISSQHTLPGISDW